MAYRRTAKAIKPDYDDRPERFLDARDILRRHGPGRDIHHLVARRFLAEGLTPVLDVGCGDGELARNLPAGAWVGVDSSAEMLRRAPRPSVRAEATSLPFPDASFDSVALLYVLYHLPDPSRALAEARRVLRPGGLVCVAAPSRTDSPELAHLLGANLLTFDAEIAPELLAELFEDVEAQRWDAALLELPDRDAVMDYLVGKGVTPDEARRGSGSVDPPLTITKRGALVFGRKPEPPGDR